VWPINEIFIVLECCRPLDAMVEAVVRAFVDAKLARKDVSVALYAVAPDLNGQTFITKLTTRVQTSMSFMLRTAPGVRFPQIEFTVFMFFSSMVGATRALLQGGASRKMEGNLSRHLVLLGQAYLKAYLCFKG
jgi:hypothetical protein